MISLFENLVASIVTMKDGSASDVEFMQRAANSISVSMNEDSVRVLGGFIPSIHALVSNAAYTNKPDGEPERVSHWRLGFLLSRLLAAILRVGRFVIFCLDDLQWSDSAMLKLIKEFIISAGELQHGKNQFLFVGTHRDIEATDSHPLTNQLTDLQQNQSVDVTEMKLAGLSKEDVATMV